MFYTIQYNTIQYNTIELYCPVNGKFVYSVREKVNKNTIVIKKIIIISTYKLTSEFLPTQVILILIMVVANIYRYI